MGHALTHARRMTEVRLTHLLPRVYKRACQACLPSFREEEKRVKQQEHPPTPGAKHLCQAAREERRKEKEMPEDLTRGDPTWQEASGHPHSQGMQVVPIKKSRDPAGVM